MRIEPFGVEMWMNAHETRCLYNVAESCVDSVTLAELTDLARKTGVLMDELLPLKLTYGAIEGSPRLRRAIAALYKGRREDEVVVTHGAIGANALLYKALIGPGDEMVSIVPTYQQHTSIPESQGGQVRRLTLKAQDGYLPNLEDLASLVTPRTKLIALTNPNNPTGALIDERRLRAIAEIAAAHDAWVICDEVYRGVDQTGDDLSPSIAEVYPKGIAVGSMSKAFALAGLRLGWIVAPPGLLHEVMIHRDYDTISVGAIDDHLAAIALESRDALLARNRGVVRTNLATLTAWMEQEPRMSWVRPAGGTVTLLRYDASIGSMEFCTRLLEETGVLLAPGAVFGMEGTVRIGFGNGAPALAAGLDGLSRYLRSLPP